MLDLYATEHGYRLEIDDYLGRRGYDINSDYIDEIVDEETCNGIEALLTEIEIISENTRAARERREAKEQEDQRDEDIARANQGRL